MPHESATTRGQEVRPAAQIPAWRKELYDGKFTADQLQTMLRIDDPRAYELFAKWLGQSGWRLLADAINQIDEDGEHCSSLHYFPSAAIARLDDPEERRWHMNTLLMLERFPSALSVWEYVDVEDSDESERWLKGGRIIGLLADAAAVRRHLAPASDGKVRAISRHDANGWESGKEVVAILRREHLACSGAAALFESIPDQVRQTYEPLRAVAAELKRIPVETAFSLHDSLVEFGTRLDDNDARDDDDVEDWWESWTSSGFDYSLNVILTSFDTKDCLVGLHDALTAAASAFDPSNRDNMRILRKLGAVKGRTAEQDMNWCGQYMDVKRTHRDLVTFRDAYGKVVEEFQRVPRA